MTTNIGNIGNSTINGDGTTAGIGNSVVVNKSHNNHYHNAPNGGGGNGSTELFALGVMGIFLFVTGAYYFALNANLFYQITLVIAAGQVSLTGSAIVFRLSQREVSRDLWRELVALILTVAAAFVSHHGWEEYPDKLVQQAQISSSITTFWCSLNNVGHAIALQQLLSAATLTLALLLLLPHSLSIISQHLLNPAGRFNRIVVRVTSSSGLIVAGILIAATWGLLVYAGPYIASMELGFKPMCPGWG